VSLEAYPFPWDVSIKAAALEALSKVAGVRFSDLAFLAERQKKIQSDR
jgi:hypothetical protein